MIKTIKQLEVSKQAAKKFRDAIRQLTDDPDWCGDPVLRNAEIAGMESQLHELDKDIKHFETANEVAT